MRKVHVITHKEAVEEAKLTNCDTVILDVFLATSTIVFLLNKGYEHIYAVENREKALQTAAEIVSPYILLGEANGEAIEGFGYPDPTHIVEATSSQAAIICSTNGTKAINKAKAARRLLMGSLINGHAVADYLHKLEGEATILIICSGNDGRMSMEDFIGAGQIVHHLSGKGDYSLSDASILAKEVYRQSRDENFENLRNCETAQLLHRVGFSESISYVLAHVEQLDVVAVLDGNRIVDYNSAINKVEKR